MAKIPLGIIGPFVGSIGPIVGSSWKGQPHIKAKYKPRTKKVSAEELGNRAKFAASQAWLQPIIKFIREGFKGYAEKLEGFNAAKSFLSKHAFEGEIPDVRVNPALMQVSYGDLPLPAGITVEHTAPGTLQFNWDASNAERGHPKDQVMMMAYDIDNGRSYSSTTGLFRHMGADALSIPPAQGRTYHLYCAFNGVDRASRSHSVYLGTIVD